ncbi:MAG: gamma-glutamyl-gamma-aminobutyrate hydrolase family protein [Clostridia bacterium]|nr:gamma-glutamyl-gamma-aminobutyrate hydrolase family protein [Clostridia bacterium]
MKPMIGVFGEINAERFTGVRHNYCSAVERAGGVPLLLPYAEEDETVARFIEACDGFLFTGGADVSPERYQEAAKPTCGERQIYRDEMEFSAFSKAIRTHKPILGICRGAQVINVALGGTLFQDISSEISRSIPHRQSEPYSVYSHEINVVPDTPLYALTGGKTRIQTNSFHHQAFKTLGKGLTVMATADDGVVEAAYLRGERYLRAYQWHPEGLYDIDEHNRKIFENFIDACR